jgi:hypothetical protein
MARYKPITAVSINAKAGGQDARIMAEANRQAAQVNEPVGSFLRRLLERVFGIETETQGGN